MLNEVLKNHLGLVKEHIEFKSFDKDATFFDGITGLGLHNFDGDLTLEKT